MVHNRAAAGSAPQPFAASGPSSELELEFISSHCGNGTCPTLYRTNRDTLVVQGYVVDPGQAGVSVPEGELLVEIPVELLEQFAQHPRP